jgi:predicted RNase H-like HicB family nuclease
MNSPQTTLYVNVEYSTDDEKDGPVYVASNDALSLVTDGRSFEELLVNLREAIAVCLEDTDTVAEFNLLPNPRVVLTVKLPENYAQTA